MFVDHNLAKKAIEKARYLNQEFYLKFYGIYSSLTMSVKASFNDARKRIVLSDIESMT